MSESKLKWEPYGYALTANQRVDLREASYWILRGAEEYILRSSIHRTDKFSDLESAKAFAEKLEGLTDEHS